MKPLFTKKGLTSMCSPGRKPCNLYHSGIIGYLFCWITLFTIPQSSEAASKQMAIGDWINSIETNKSMYSPGSVVDFTLSLKQTGIGQSLQVQYFHLNTIISSQIVSVSGATVNWSWVTPNADYKGYLVKVALRNSGNSMIDQTTIGVDVSSNWMKFPRYGFLSKFGQLSDGDMDVVINKLNRYHINGIQFYDWMDTHHDPLAGTASSPASQWNDLANRPTYLSSVKGYIDRAHNKNMSAMFYNLIYGAYPDAPNVSESWGLYRDNNHSQQWAHCCLPSSWETTTIPGYDPGNVNWRSYINEKHNEVYNASGLSFDGFHADQLGDFGGLYTYNGTLTYPDQSFDDFLNAAKSARPDKHLVMNSVNQYGQQYIAQAPVSFTYTEVWGGNEEYFSLGNIIQQNNAFKNTNTVLAAYVNKGKSGSPGMFNDASVLMADAVIFAFGGAHIELGEHMLGNEYFPNSNLQMSNQLQKDLTTYYDFSVAYENILRDGRVFNNVTLSGGNSSTTVRHWPPVQGNVTTVGVEWGNNQVFHVLNYKDAQHLYWRDDNQTQPVPTTITNLPFNFPYSTTITRMWVASPDFNQGLPQTINFTQSNGTVTFQLPQLKYWTMIVAETSSATGSSASPAFSPGGSSFVYTGPLQVTLSSTTPDAIIRYTLDGSTPTSISPLYTGPIILTNSCTVKAYSSKAGMIDSPVSSSAYTINIPSGGVVSGGIYKIAARHSGKGLEIAGGVTATHDGAVGQQWEFLNGANQKWKIDALENGFYKITATHTGKALDVEGGSLNDGTNVHQWTPLNINSQQWSLYDVGGGFVRIVNRNSGKCLDVYGASTDNGAAVKQYTYTGSSHQQWSLSLLSSGRLVSTSKNDQKEVNLYPNPAENVLTINLPENATSTEIKIINSQGKEVFKELIKDRHFLDIDTGELKAGVYSVIIKTGKILSVKQLIIK